ncbi:MAG: Nicotinate phosphoribosyltransferase pncB2 [Chlamydiia bacterium]|nr:Nicotinate phosphoribosyltransferase pncB2 [Chlamydiia bacterium]MCH9615307.1 Nicotinate phosphoribosyltransferase pncB2 [Chlamydiia bacterium]MCH9628371.1 Nicotinate phosphoribosyltransferase pncB2 [Chlamydiia bacterium]
MEALLTDLYELTMAYGYWKSGMQNFDAAFHLFYRSNPFNGEYAIAAGLDTVIKWLDRFHFSDSDLDYLEELDLFEIDFIDYLSKLKFSCDIDACHEGTYVFPYQPLVRVKGPILQAQLIESALLNAVNFQTLIATKASHVCKAAQGDEVVEFGLRRAQGFDGALSAARAAFIGGCQSTSNTLAGKKFGIPVSGTHAHSWVMAFDQEEKAFEEYAKAFPHNSIYLVDTYDTLRGVKRAIEVGKRTGAMQGIRLDSGDIAELSVKARRMLDEAGFKDAKIVASNELDDVKIREFKEKGAKVDVWGVGTHLVTAKDQPALDGVYKLGAIKKPGGDWNYRIKATKGTTPGILQVKRLDDRDIIFDEMSGFYSDGGEDLLVPIMRNGRLVYTSPSLQTIQKRTRQQALQIKFPHYVELEDTLSELKEELLHESLNHR